MQYYSSFFVILEENGPLPYQVEGGVISQDADGSVTGEQF